MRCDVRKNAESIWPQLMKLAHVTTLPTGINPNESNAIQSSLEIFTRDKINSSASTSGFVSRIVIEMSYHGASSLQHKMDMPPANVLLSMNIW